MKFLSLMLLGLASLASARYNGNKFAKHIDQTSKKNIKAGKYLFRNAKTHHSLQYTRSGQQLSITKGKGSYISIKKHLNHVIMSPAGSNDKCISTAWDYGHGVDRYAALYKCAVTHFKRDGTWTPDMKTKMIRSDIIAFDDEHRLEKRVKLRSAKQMFYVHPGSKPHSYHIVAVDHLTDQPARVLADSTCKLTWGAHAKAGCLVALNDKDPSQTWYLYDSHGRRV